LQNVKENILKNVGNQTVLVTIGFHCMDKKRDKKIISYIQLCSTEESHTVLEQHG